jgi:transposase-like protein
MGHFRYSEAEKRRLVQQWLRSDECLAEFARAHQVSVGSLTRWREELKSGVEQEAADGTRPLKFVEVGVVDRSATECSSPTVAAELILPGGVVLRVFSPKPTC